MKRLYLINLLLVAALFFMLLGCGGGSGTESTTGDLTPDTRSGTGTVALMLTDGPADAYDRIMITLERVLLLTADGESQVVVFDPDSPVEYDLLNLRPEDDDDAGALLAVEDVPAGLYSKIRLVVSKVQGEVDLEDGSVDTTTFKLASGKIDLNPRGQFEVAPDTTLAITLDIDCDKSIHLSGNKKVFRPVVFVDIETVNQWQRCPRIMKGTIAALTYAEDQTTVVGFELTLDANQEQIPILLDAFTTIIDDEGQVGDVQTLSVGEAVYVRGTLTDGGVLASLVVVGDIDRYDGVVTTAVVDDLFTIADDVEQTVEITDGTLILWGCDTLISPDAIQPGMKARVIGKTSEDGHIVAVAVLLRPQLMTGTITAMEAVEGGYALSLAVANASEGEAEASDTVATIFLPADTPVTVKFDGTLSTGELFDLVACGDRQAMIAIDFSAEQTLTAAKVIVLPEYTYAEVQSVDTALRLLTTDIGLVSVKSDAHIFDLRIDENNESEESFNLTAPHHPNASLSDIEDGDQLLIYGLSACPETDDDPDFTAMVILILLAPPELQQ